MSARERGQRSDSVWRRVKRDVHAYFLGGEPTLAYATVVVQAPPLEPVDGGGGGALTLWWLLLCAVMLSFRLRQTGIR